MEIIASDIDVRLWYSLEVLECIVFVKMKNEKKCDDEMKGP